MKAPSASILLLATTLLSTIAPSSSFISPHCTGVTSGVRGETCTSQRTVASSLSSSVAAPWPPAASRSALIQVLCSGRKTSLGLNAQVMISPEGKLKLKTSSSTTLNSSNKESEIDPDNGNNSNSKKENTTENKFGDNIDEYDVEKSRKEFQMELQWIQNQLLSIQALEARNRAQIDSFVDGQALWESLEEEEQNLLLSKNALLARMEEIETFYLF